MGKKKKAMKLNWKLLKNKVIQVNYNAAIKYNLERKSASDNRDTIKTTQSNYTNLMVDATLQAAADTIQGEGRVSKDWFKTSETTILQAIRLGNYWGGRLDTHLRTRGYTQVPKKG
jgi:hypothetical protein